MVGRRLTTEMLDSSYTSFDKDFYDKVRAVELEISADAEERLNSSLKEFDNKDIELKRAQTLDIQSRIAGRVLEKYDWKRHGRRIEQVHSGVIVHQLEEGPVKIERLMQEQREILAYRGASLPLALPESTEQSVIDVEVVQEKVVSE